ncbi:hypothetical protein DKY63_04875 [Pseudomonas putida]|uniref:Uncharacterized protein n=1 Tax=Pseudomonas putida TaxID=303 RepID=A0A2Z4RE54_PSEPU|nr:hypothetical protein DKY63_04875 [Pseudomonas putida]
MGASLLAKAVCQTTKLLDVLAPSRAGSLPQYCGVVIDRRSACRPAKPCPRCAKRSARLR